MHNKHLSRIGAVAGLLALSLGVVACNPSAREESSGELAPTVGEPGKAGYAESGSLVGEKLIWTTSPGDYATNQNIAFVEPFGEITGADVTISDETTDLSKLKAMLETDSVTWDVMATESTIGEGQCGTLFEPLDFSKIDTSQLREDLVGECVIPSDIEVRLLAYNPEAEVFKDDVPTKLEDFFDTKKFPGKRGIDMYPGFPLVAYFEMALLADGVAPEDMYPLDYERAFRKFDTIKEDLVIASSVPDLRQQFEAGNVVMSIEYSSNAALMALDGVAIEPVWDKWSAILVGTAIPKGSQNVDASYAWLNYIAGKEPQGRFSEIHYYPMANLEVDVEYPKEVEPWMPSSEELADQHLPSLDYYSDPKTFEEILNAYNEWFATY